MLARDTRAAPCSAGATVVRALQTPPNASMRALTSIGMPLASKSSNIHAGMPGR